MVIFVVLAWFLYDGLGRDTKKIPSPLIGKNFPILEVEDFETGDKFQIQTRLKGKVSLVNVWASWCFACRAEHQMLNNIAAKNSLQIVGINYKDNENNKDNKKEDGAKFLRLLGNPYDFIVFDEKGKLGLELGVYGVPETYLVDKDGIIKFKRVGEITHAVWQQQMLPLIRQLEKQ